MSVTMIEVDGTDRTVDREVLVPDNSENIDEWALSGKYSSHGFTFGAAYEVQPDAIQNAVVTEVTGANNDTVAFSKEDKTFWALRGGYGQDNWSVNAWYGESNTSEQKNQYVDVTPADSATETASDTKIFSLAGNIDLGKVALVGIFEQRDNRAAQEDSVFVFNADYKFTSRSKAYLAYIANDFDSNSDKDDEIRLGLRMDF